jgi:lipopolysaccharide export system protein LptC
MMNNLSYRRTVGVLRVVFPLVTAGVGGLLLMAAVPASKIDPLVFASAQQQQQTRPGLITNPRFLGVDEQQQPFSLKAASAQQQGGSGNLSLDGISGSLSLHTGEKAEIRASRAWYDHQARKVFLQGSIKLNDGRGYALGINELAVDIHNKSAVTTGAVSGQTPEGAIAAGGMEVYEGGKRVVFRGAPSVQVTENGDSVKKPAMPVIRLQ